jgi:glycosyltransferase involved in cell wall biosynthesis
MYRLLRIGNYPTDFFCGAGYHAYKVTEYCACQTTVVSEKLEGRPLPIPQNVKLIRTFPVFIAGKPCKSFVDRALRAFRAMAFAIRVSPYIFQHDAVHIHSPAYFPIAFLAKLCRKKIFITFHGSDFNVLRKSNVLTRLLRGFDHVFYLGSHMDPYFAEKGIHRRTEVMNGVDPHVFYDMDQPRQQRIVSIGTLKKEKGFNVLIDAIKLLKESARLNGHSLTIVGAGPLEGQLKDQVRRLNLMNEVEFVGHKRREEIVGILNSAEIFVLSSISEGVPKVLLEAIACGAKIVSSRVGSVQKILGDGYALLCSPDNSVDLASKIAICSSDRTNEFKIDSTSFSWKRVSESYENVYDTMLG